MKMRTGGWERGPAGGENISISISIMETNISRDWIGLDGSWVGPGHSFVAQASKPSVPWPTTSILLY